MVSREISVQNQGMGRKFMQEDLHLLLKSNAINIHSILKPTLQRRQVDPIMQKLSLGVPTSTSYKVAPRGSTPYLLAGGTQVGADFEIH